MKSKMNLFELRKLNNSDIELLKSVSNAFNLKVTDISDISVIDVSNGFLLANVNKLTTKCNGISIWYTNDDIGIRVHKDFYNACTVQQKFLLDTLSSKKNTIKERRYSFFNIKDVLSFISALQSYSNADIATKEVVVNESVSA